jgi:transposase
MDKHWAPDPLPRDQLEMFPRMLDDAIAPDHVIRILDHCLNNLDWSDWEAQYDGHLGQPAIHPRVMAGCILYGMMCRVRSSRALEEATRMRLDFIWFTCGRTIDHTTFAQFRTRHDQALKRLNRQIVRLILDHHEERLLALITDGTRVRADSDRHGARTAAGLERLVNACVRELDKRLQRLAESDAQGEGHEEELEALRREVCEHKAKIEELTVALEVARQRDARKQAIEGEKATPVRVPVTDPEAQITPNKEGGYAPNFTPAVAVDPASRAIVYGDVMDGSEEGGAVAAAVEEVQEAYGETPALMAADSGFASGENLEWLKAHGVEAYMPTGADFSESNPANRPDPSQPVPESERERLPRRGGKLAASAFVYDAAKDIYHCPMGQELHRVRSGKHSRTGIGYTQYACPGRAGCPLGDQCVKKDTRKRMIVRDEYQGLRDEMGRRMATEEGRAIYQMRAPVVEGVFAEIKHGMGIRRFLLRGLRKVRIEWSWICAAFNLKRLLRLMAALVDVPKGSDPRKRAISGDCGTQGTLELEPTEGYFAAGSRRDGRGRFKPQRCACASLASPVVKGFRRVA